MIKIALSYLFLIMVFFGYSQDIHYSQFDKSPLILNPALCGDFNGDWRFSANQRSQWRSVSRAFNTFSVSGENKQELLLPNLYFGATYLNDVAGDGNLRTNELNINGTYKLYLSSDSTITMSSALQIGINHKSLKYDALKFDSQFNGYKYDFNIPNNELLLTNRFTNLNLGLGFIINQKLKKSGQLKYGIAAYNLMNKKESFLGNNSIKRDKRINIYASMEKPINFEWDIMPSVLLQFQGDYKEIIIGSNVRYLLTDKKGEYIAPYAGIWYRNKDAIFITAGMYYNNWIAGISYDINISALSPASRIRGGLEFSVQYILSIFKPDLIQYRQCPDYL